MNCSNRWIPILFLFCFFVFFGKASAQNNSLYMGFVLDALTREPIIGATMTDEKQTLGAITDTLGAFQLNIPQNKIPIAVTIRAIGYQTWVGNWEKNSEKQRTILLEPTENALGTVVISATMKEVRKDASPIPVEIFSPKFFQKNAAPSIFESLTAVNGVRPQLNCNVCNTGDIHINGMEGPYTMVTIDGMPIVSGLSTVYGLSGIPNGIIERIEVVKGPASTLYGSEAVGGMINLITKKVESAPRFYVDVFGTNIEEYNVDGALTAKLGSAQTLFGVNFFNFQNRLDINADNFTDIALQNRVSVFNKWSFERKNNRVASIAGRFVYENRWGGELQWDSRWRGTDSIYGESVFTRRFEVLGKYQLPIEGRRMMFDGSWNLHDQDSYYGTTLFLAKQQVAFAQLSTDLPLGNRHDALLGAALRFTNYDDNTPATASPDGGTNLASKTWLPGVFIQDEIALNAKHSVLLGLRYDYNSAHGSILTPRFSWKWTKNPQQILRFTTGSGYRIANIFTEDHAALTGAREVVLAENLLPERSWNGNLNYVHKFYPKHAGFIGLDASLFYTYFSNQIIPDYETDPNQIIFDNLDGFAVSSGASLNLDFNFLSGLKIIAGASAMDVFRVENNERKPQLFAPPLSGTWTATYPMTKLGLTLDYTGNLNSPMHLPVLPNDLRPEKSPWFSLHNIQATWRPSEVFPSSKGWKGAEIYLGMKNIFGFYPSEEVILRAFDPFDKRIEVDNPNGFTFDPTYNYAPIQRQRVLLGWRWTIE